MTTSVRIVIPTRGANPGLTALLADIERELRTLPSADVAVAVIDAGGSAAENRNLGARGATEKWLQFIDDDVRLPPGWLIRLVAALEGPETADLIGGTVGSLDERNWFSQAAEDFVIRHKLYPEGWYLVSAHLTVRTSAFVELGGFDESFATAGGEDWDLCRRAHARGLSVAVCESVVCAHDNPTTWRQLAARARTYGRGSLRLEADVTPPQPSPASSGSSSSPATPSGRRTSIRAGRWVIAEYRDLRGRGRGRVRAARSTALYVPWMATYLRSQRQAAGIITQP